MNGFNVVSCSGSSVAQYEQDLFHLICAHSLDVNILLCTSSEMSEEPLSVFGVSSVSEWQRRSFFHSETEFVSCAAAQSLCTINIMAIRKRDSFLWGKGMNIFTFNHYFTTQRCPKAVT